MIHPLQEYAVMHTFCRGCFFEYGTKMAVSNILYLEADGSVSVYKDLPLRDEVLTREEYAHRIRSTPLVHATTKLYSRDIFETFRFPVGKLYEDACILPDLLEKITETVCVAEPLYHYRINPASIMHRKVTLKNLEEIRQKGCGIPAVCDHEKLFQKVPEKTFPGRPE